MVTKSLYIILAAALALSSTMSWAYNQELAASYHKLFQPVAGAKAGKALHLIKPEVFVEDLKKGKRYVVIDVLIDINLRFHIFTIVIVCKSGTRATAAGTALRHIGFNDVYILKGGLKALSAYLDPKVANTTTEPVKESAK